MKHYIILITLLIFLSMLFIPMTSCKSEEQTTKIVAEFDDGSTILKQGGKSYIHKLFDDYILVSGDSRFSQYVIKRNEFEIYSEANTTVICQGYYMRYAFDPAGYIACYRLISDEQETGDGVARQFGSDTVVCTDEGYYLYNCNEDLELHFDTTGELFGYCEAENIELGQWYYGYRYAKNTEAVISEVNGYSICETPLDNYIVRTGREDLFTGEIDEYAAADDFLAFHFQIIEDKYYYTGAENSIVQYDTDLVCGRKFKGLTQGFFDIYYDGYFVINTQSDEISSCASRKEAESYLNSKSVQVKWSDMK